MEELVPERRLMQFKDQLTKGCINTQLRTSAYMMLDKAQAFGSPLRLCFTYQTRGEQNSTPARKFSTVSSQCALLEA